MGQRVGILIKDFFEVITTRRSVRRYKPDLVPDALIHKLIDAARWAPTGGNMQPWEFFVIKDQQTKEAIVQTTYIGYDKKTGRPQRWILDAPVIILVGTNIKRTGARYGRFGAEFVASLDVAAAIENMLLAATALGLGSCWIAGFDTPQLNKVLNLPKEIQPLSLITIGYPKKIPAPPPRLSVQEITTYLKPREDSLP